MTRVVVIGPDNNGTCALCGKQDELRPYGPNGESICFECGMKDEATTSRQFLRLLGIDDDVTPRGSGPRSPAPGA